MTHKVVSPGPGGRTVLNHSGATEPVPDGWEFLPSGDAGLTRRVKAAGPVWVVQERRGRKVLTRGIWALSPIIEKARGELAAERSTPAYARRKEGAAKRREKLQGQYVEDFRAAVRSFLAFAPAHTALADRLADVVAAHATPVGSGTVARTQRIPIERRAEAAVIAWLRHQTTGYDGMTIPRVKGQRREARRMLAARSRELLAKYRSGAPVDPAACPLARALAGGDVAGRRAGF
jgi:hypothetical protein